MLPDNNTEQFILTLILTTEKSPPRSMEKPEKVQEEQRWFSSPYAKPSGVPQDSWIDDMSSFKDLIWKNPTRDIIPFYGKFVLITIIHFMVYATSILLLPVLHIMCLLATTIYL